MRFLDLRISLSKHGARFTPPEAKLPEKTLALSSPKIDFKPQPNKCGQRFAVPQVSNQPGLPRCASESLVDLLQLNCVQAFRSPWSFTVDQTGQTMIFKAMHPIFNGAFSITQQSRNLRASHPLRNKKHCMKPMVVARFLGTANFILQSEYDIRSIGYRERFHGTMKSYSCIIRKYL